MDNVIDGWQYFAFFYYYSNGSQVMLTNTSTYTMAFPVEPEVMPGDVNSDGIISITDVTDLIDYLLSQDPTGIDVVAADADGSGDVGISDLTELVDLVLKKPIGK